jgi:hypothetical protein
VTDEQTERFTVWGSRIMGAIGLLAVAFVALPGLLGNGDRFHPAVYLACGFVAVGIWAVLIRPSVSVQDQMLVLRNPLSTVRIPLVTVDDVAIRRWLAVGAGGRQFTNPALSRSHRQGRRDDRRDAETGAEAAQLSYAAFVERRIGRMAEEARTAPGGALSSEEQAALARDVRREPAWVEIGLLVVLGLAFVVAVLL